MEGYAIIATALRKKLSEKIARGGRDSGSANLGCRRIERTSGMGIEMTARRFLRKRISTRRARSRIRWMLQRQETVARVHFRVK